MIINLFEHTERLLAIRERCDTVEEIWPYFGAPTYVKTCWMEGQKSVLIAWGYWKPGWEFRLYLNALTDDFIVGTAPLSEGRGTVTSHWDLKEWISEHRRLVAHPCRKKPFRTYEAHETNIKRWLRGHVPFA